MKISRPALATILLTATWIALVIAGALSLWVARTR